MDVFFMVTTAAVVVMTLLLVVVFLRVLSILKKIEQIADMVSLEGEQIREDIRAVRAKVRDGGVRLGEIFGFLGSVRKTRRRTKKEPSDS